MSKVGWASDKLLISGKSFASSRFHGEGRGGGYFGEKARLAASCKILGPTNIDHNLGEPISPCSKGSHLRVHDGKAILTSTQKRPGRWSGRQLAVRMVGEIVVGPEHTNTVQYSSRSPR
jgi:hypothetical protein